MPLHPYKQWSHVPNAFENGMGLYHDGFTQYIYGKSNENGIRINLILRYEEKKFKLMEKIGEQTTLLAEFSEVKEALDYVKIWIQF